VTGTLGDIARRARAAGIGSPALLFIGDVARYASSRVRASQLPDIRSSGLRANDSGDRAKETAHDLQQHHRDDLAIHPSCG
jgi:hypothetical protein